MTNRASSTTIEKPTAESIVGGSGAALVALSPTDRYALDLIVGKASIDEVPPVDGAALHEAIMASAAEAETAEELFADETLAKGQTFLGQPMQVEAVTFRPSNFPEGSAVYAIVDAKIKGEPVRFSLGWADALWKLYLAKSRGYLPLPFAVRFDPIEGETSGGFRPIKVRRA